MSYEFFLKQLVKYKPFEEISSDKICIINKVSILNTNDDNKYDFQTTDEKKYEVKCDERALTTNNYFIEFIGYGKPSGISVSEADYYILTDTNIYYLIDIEILKKIIIGKPILTTKDKSTYGYIVKRSIISENSIII